MSAVRAESVGTDTLSYIKDYAELGTYSLSDVLEQYKDYEGFYVFSWLCHKAGLSLQVWLCLVSMMLILPVAKFIDSYSKDKIYSVLCFLSMGAFEFSLAGIKQTMAMGIMLSAFYLLIKKRYILSFLFGVWAYFCHKTSLIFLLVIPLYLFRGGKYFKTGIIILCVLFFSFFRQVFVYLINLLNSDRYMTYLEDGSAYSPTPLIFYITILLITFLFSDNKNKDQDEDFTKFLFAVSIVCMAFQCFAFVSASAFRVSLYFLPFFGIYIPNALEGKSKTYIKIILACMIIFYFIYTNRDFVYKFCWSSMS